MKPYIIDYYGCYVFNDEQMKRRLSPFTYKRLKSVMQGEGELTFEIADEVAAAMKQWAVEQGATHYTHWFQPMTGATAEKHDAFVSPDGEGRLMLDFNGKLLIKGEADASSFPSGGLRATFEARGYTTWDCTSPPFIKKDACGNTTLCIPTAFCSFTGEALDEKTPLLRSMQAISKQAMRVLRCLGVDANRVMPTVGAEQEYFLIDKQVYKKRKDLIYTGRTLFGAPPAKGQELDDQYYASMNERVSAFMAQVNEELWKLGVPAKTQHYEVAPAQYELAPMFDTANIAVDHNMIVMDVLSKMADRNNFACLLHEKPFNHVNGSGKHNNWSLITDKGKNLLKPGKNKEDSIIFLTFLLATIAAVDKHAAALRMSCATLGNCWRLGGNEAPPTIISIFVGNVLENAFKLIEESGSGKKIDKMTMGVQSLPVLFRDEADRNRTSPFAFTGNKFEFRMAGSSQSLGLHNTVINTIVAEELEHIADRLEKAADVEAEIISLLYENLENHKRVLYNGNNYSDEWQKEAAQRGLPILDSTVDAINVLAYKELINAFKKQEVYSSVEMEARRIIALKSYIKHASIEATTMLKISHQTLLPACVGYTKALADAFISVKNAGVDGRVQYKMLTECNDELALYSDSVEHLEKMLEESKLNKEPEIQARAFENNVIPAMITVRASADKLEKMVDKQSWPLPSYGEMLFYIV